MWTSSYAAPFNSTTFEIEFGGTVVATAAAAPVSPIDHAAGTVRPYIPAVFEVQSLLEQGRGLSLAYNRPSHPF